MHTRIVGSLTSQQLEEVLCNLQSVCLPTGSENSWQKCILSEEREEVRGRETVGVVETISLLWEQRGQCNSLYMTYTAWLSGWKGPCGPPHRLIQHCNSVSLSAPGAELMTRRYAGDVNTQRGSMLWVKLKISRIAAPLLKMVDERVGSCIYGPLWTNIQKSCK